MLSVERIQSQIDGLLGGGEIGAFYNKMIENQLPDFISTNEFGELFSSFVFGRINGVLQSSDMFDRFFSIMHFGENVEGFNNV